MLACSFKKVQEQVYLCTHLVTSELGALKAQPYLEMILMHINELGVKDTQVIVLKYFSFRQNG